MRTRTKKILLGTGGGLITVTALIGVMHMPFAQEMLGGCPFGGKTTTASRPERDALRVAATERLKQGPATAQLPAGQLTLGTTTRAQVIAAASAVGLICEDTRDASGLKCGPAEVPAIGARRWFADFDASEHLVSLVTMDYVNNAGVASTMLRDSVAELDQSVGEATHRTGTYDDAYLSAATLRQARVEYRRSNYFAQVSATNVGPGRFMVSQTYRAI